VDRQRQARRPPACVSAVRVAARRPGSRLAAGPGNGPARSPASKALAGGATVRSVRRSPPRRQWSRLQGRGKGAPSPGAQGEGHGSGEEPGRTAAKDSPAQADRERAEGGGGNRGGPPRRGGPRRRAAGSVALYNRSTPGSGRGAGRAPAAAAPPLEPHGQLRPPVREGPLLRRCALQRREGPASALASRRTRQGPGPAAGCRAARADPAEQRFPANRRGGPNAGGPGRTPAGQA